MDGFEFYDALAPIDNPSGLLKKLMLELAQTLKLLEKRDGTYVRSSSPKKTDAKTLADWTEVGLLRYLEVCLTRKAERLNEQYGIIQAHDDCCWAACTVVAKRMMGETWKDEIDYFEKQALPFLPTVSHITAALNHIINTPNGANYYPAQNLLQGHLPATNSVQDRIEFFCYAPVEILEAAVRTKVITFEKRTVGEYETECNWIKEYLMVRHPDWMTAGGHRVTLPRKRSVEKTYFKSVGLTCSEEKIEDFSEQKLATLMDGKSLIVALNSAAMISSGATLQKALGQLEKKTDVDYGSHYVVALHYSPILDRVYILNTLPYVEGIFISARDNYATGSMLVTLSFQDFKRALVSDVTCLSKIVLPDTGASQLTAAEAKTLPIISFPFHFTAYSAF